MRQMKRRLRPPEPARAALRCAGACPSIGAPARVDPNLLPVPQDAAAWLPVARPKASLSRGCGGGMARAVARPYGTAWPAVAPQYATLPKGCERLAQRHHHITYTLYFTSMRDHLQHSHEVGRRPPLFRAPPIMRGTWLRPALLPSGAEDLRITAPEG